MPIRLATEDLLPKPSLNKQDIRTTNLKCVQQHIPIQLFAAESCSPADKMPPGKVSSPPTQTTASQNSRCTAYQVITCTRNMVDEEDACSDKYLMAKLLRNLKAPFNDEPAISQREKIILWQVVE